MIIIVVCSQTQEAYDNEKVEYMRSWISEKVRIPFSIKVLPCFNMPNISAGMALVQISLREKERLVNR